MAENSNPTADRNERETGQLADAATGAGAGAGAGTRNGRVNRRRNTATATNTQAETAETSHPVEAPKLEIVQESPKKTRKRRTRKTSAVVGQETATLICETISLMATSLHPEAGLQPVERALIEPPLGRMLERASPEALARYTGIVDPVLVGVGLALYAARIQKLVKPAAPTLRQSMVPTPNTDPRPVPVLRQNLRVRDDD